MKCLKSRYRPVVTGFAMGCLLAMGMNQASAGFILEFGQSGTIVTSGIDVTGGSEIELEYYLTQTDGETRLNDDGLSAFYIGIQITGDGGVTHSTTSSFEFQVGLNTFPEIEIDGALSRLTANVIGDERSGGLEVDPKTVVAGVNSILLGRSVLNVNPLATGSYSVSLSDPSNGIGFSSAPNTIDDSFTATMATTQLNVIAVPDATSLRLFAVGFAGLMLARGRRLRTASRTLS